jgi:hypothetical protein
MESMRLDLQSRLNNLENPPMSSNLIASAASIDNLTKLINRYFYSESYSVNKETLKIEHPTKPIPEGFRVVKQGKRYRFEHQQQEQRP